MDALRTSIGGPPARVLPRKKQSTGLFFLPLLRFACAGDFATCGSRRGLLALDPARAARPLTLARALPSRQHKSGVSVRRLQVYVRNGVQPGFIEKEKEITEETQCVTAYY